MRLCIFFCPNPVLHFPNEITDKDFEGWIQERGIYFAQRMDPRYQAIFSMHDSGEPDQNGSLIKRITVKENLLIPVLCFSANCRPAFPALIDYSPI